MCENDVYFSALTNSLVIATMPRPEYLAPEAIMLDARVAQTYSKDGRYTELLKVHGSLYSRYDREFRSVMCGTSDKRSTSSYGIG
jgi:hypothetical protein